MNLAAAAPIWLQLLFAFLLAAAAAEDAWRLRISNVTCLLILVAAIVAVIIEGPRLSLWQNLAMIAMLLALGTPLFAAGVLGGGDVKLFAVCGAWFGLRGGTFMLISVLLSGGVLAVLILALRAFGMGAKYSVSAKVSPGIPYGVAIACGTLLVLR